MSFVAKRKCNISILLLASVWMLTITPVAAAEDDTFPQSNDGALTALTIARNADIMQMSDDGKAICLREIAAKAIMLAAQNTTMKESNHE